MPPPASATIVLKRTLKVREKLNIMVNSERGNLILRSWSLLHRVRDLLMRCEDESFGKYGLTSEQFAVLVTIKYIGESAKPTDIARWLARSPNSISMIVDRMVKAGLVRRVRSRGDRRVVRVIITSKGESALKPATVDGLEFIKKLMLPLSDENLSTFVRLLEMVRREAFDCLRQEVTIEEMRENDITSQADLMEQLRKYTSLSTPQSKRQGGKKGKTKRKTI
jgi:DNA-binding MarR family transcriptional regulator